MLFYTKQEKHSEEMPKHISGEKKKNKKLEKKKKKKKEAF